MRGHRLVPRRDRSRSIPSETEQTASRDSATTATMARPGASRRAATAAISPKPMSIPTKWRRLRSTSPRSFRRGVSHTGFAALTVSAVALTVSAVGEIVGKHAAVSVEALVNAPLIA